MANEVKVLGDDFSLDDVADLPEFKAFPTGAFLVNFPEGFDRKKVGDKDAVELKMVLKEVMEVKELDADEQPPVAGAICSTLYMLGNEIGQGKMKDAMKPFVEALGSKQFKAVCDFSKGKDAVVIGKRTKDGDKSYFNIASIGLV